MRTVPTYRQLGDAAMLPQPVLKLEHTLVEYWCGDLRRASDNPALTEKLDEPTRSPHVLLGHALLAANAGHRQRCRANRSMTASRRRRPRPRPAAATAKVTGCGVIAAHRQARCPNGDS